MGLDLNPDDIVVDNSKGNYYKAEYGGCERYGQEVSESVFTFVGLNTLLLSGL